MRVIHTDEITKNIREMCIEANVSLSEDVKKRVLSAKEKEESALGKRVLEQLEENLAIAENEQIPICQDTGALIFYVDYKAGGEEKVYIDAIGEAVKVATAKQYLRPNAVDPVTGKNSGNNTGTNAPYIHFHQWDKDYTRIRFMQKGGGCENCGTQYRLPDITLGAGRDLKGVRKCIIDAIYNAQGQGCAPGIIGVGIGGDRALSHILAKEQLFRKMGISSRSYILSY